MAVPSAYRSTLSTPAPTPPDLGRTVHQTRFQALTSPRAPSSNHCSVCGCDGFVPDARARLYGADEAGGAGASGAGLGPLGLLSSSSFWSSFWRAASSPPPRSSLPRSNVSIGSAPALYSGSLPSQCSIARYWRTAGVVDSRMISLAFASARARMSERVGFALRLLARGLGLAVRLRDRLLGLGLDLANAVSALDGVLRGFHRAVDRFRHVLRQAQRAVDRELIDDEAVLAEHVAALLRDVARASCSCRRRRCPAPAAWRRRR